MGPTPLNGIEPRIESPNDTGDPSFVVAWMKIGVGKSTIEVLNLKEKQQISLMRKYALVDYPEMKV